MFAPSHHDVSICVSPRWAMWVKFRNGGERPQERVKVCGKCDLHARKTGSDGSFLAGCTVRALVRSLNRVCCPLVLSFSVFCKDPFASHDFLNATARHWDFSPVTFIARYIINDILLKFRCSIIRTCYL